MKRSGSIVSIAVEDHGDMDRKNPGMKALLYSKLATQSSTLHDNFISVDNRLSVGLLNTLTNVFNKSFDGWAT